MSMAFSITYILIGYSLACLGCGYLILHILTYRPSSNNIVSAGTELANAFILGQGALASLWLLLALGGWFSRPIVTGIVIMLALAGVIFSWKRLFVFGRQLRGIWHEQRSDTWGWQSIAGLTILTCVAWVTSLGRPLTGDAAAFYMALPKVIAASHRLIPLPGYESFSNTGLQGEMHYAALMIMQSSDAAQLFAWPTMVAGAIILMALGRSAGLGRRGQWIALAALFTSSAVIWLSGDGKTDLFAVSLGLAAYYWVLKVRTGQRRLALWLIGLFSGFAIVAKFSYLPVMAPGIVLILIWNYLDDLRDPVIRKQALASILSAGLLIFAGLLLAVTPHLIKNGLLFHNPLSPFGSGTMGWADQNWFGPNTTRRIILTYPLALAFGSYWAQYGNLSPLVLAFIPLAVLLPKPRKITESPLTAITIAALVGLLVWIIVFPSVLSPRYILAVLLLFILLPARAAEYIGWNETRPRLLTFGVMAAIDATIIAVGLFFLLSVFYPANSYHYLGGKLSECGRDSIQCEAMEAINEAARPGDRVFLADYSRYWLRADLIQCVSTTQEISAIGSLKNPEQRWEYLYQQGFRFFLADAGTHKALIDSLDFANPPTWLTLKMLYSDENETLKAYQLEVSAPPVQELTACRQVSPPAWDVVSH